MSGFGFDFTEDPRTGALLALEGAKKDTDAADAEMMLRRLANRHGHTGNYCPDPAAHARDLEALKTVLAATRLISYDRMIRHHNGTKRAGGSQ
jgi:hypothetical protein